MRGLVERRPAARPSAGAAGCASSARPIATRCFSPPDSAPGRRASRCADAEQLDDARRARRRRSPSRREPAAVAAGSAAPSDAETAAPPGRRSRCGGGARGTNDAARGVEQRCRRRRRCGRARAGSGPAMRLTSDGLARARAAEQRGHARPRRVKRASSAKAPTPCDRDVDVRALIARRCRRADAARQPASEASSAAIEIATEISVSRSAAGLAAGHLRQGVDRRAAGSGSRRGCWRRR